jgi:hypothetical protein
MGNLRASGILNCQITNLPNYQIDEEPKPGETAGDSDIKESGKHEGQGISKKDLRQVQDRSPQGRGARDLREFKT